MFTIKNLIMKDGTTVFNCENYAEKYDFIVARNSDGEWWFWGAWNDEAEATKAADEVGGRVFRRA